MPRLKTETIGIYGAVGPDGRILISSISAYQSVAVRWSMKYRNHRVMRLAELARFVDHNGEEPKKTNEQEPDTQPDPPIVAPPRRKIKRRMNGGH